MTYTCENIGPRERRKRLKIGRASLVVAALVAAGLLLAGAPRGWRLLALPPIWLGVIGLVQAQMRTCIRLAARGVRNMDAGDEPITDPSERQALTRQSRSVHLWTLLLTMLLIVALLALP